MRAGNFNAGQSRPVSDRLRRGAGGSSMVGFSRPSSRKERREWWRRQLARQQSENLSVTEFCRQLGIHFSTFYYWKKRVHESPSGAPGQLVLRPPAPPVTVAANFVPVSLVDQRVGTHLEIELANACVVRLDGPIDPSLLQAAITAAGQLDVSSRGAD
jgi:Transposase